MIIKTKSFRVHPDIINAILYDAPNLAQVYIAGALNPISLPREEAEKLEELWVEWLEEQEEIEETVREGNYLQ